MDYLKASESIADTMEKIGEPLTDTQKTILSGALAVWLDKYYQQGVYDATPKGFSCHVMKI